MIGETGYNKTMLPNNLSGLSITEHQPKSLPSLGAKQLMKHSALGGLTAPRKVSMKNDTCNTLVEENQRAYGQKSTKKKLILS